MLSIELLKSGLIIARVLTVSSCVHKLRMQRIPNAVIPSLSRCLFGLVACIFTRRRNEASARSSGGSFRSGFLEGQVLIDANRMGLKTIIALPHACIVISLYLFLKRFLLMIIVATIFNMSPDDYR